MIKSKEATKFIEKEIGASQWVKQSFAREAVELAEQSVFELMKQISKEAFLNASNIEEFEQIINKEYEKR